VISAHRLILTIIVLAEMNGNKLKQMVPRQLLLKQAASIKSDEEKHKRKSEDITAGALKSKITGSLEKRYKLEKETKKKKRF